VNALPLGNERPKGFETQGESSQCLGTAADALLSHLDGESSEVTRPHQKFAHGGIAGPIRAPVSQRMKEARSHNFLPGTIQLPAAVS